MKKLIKRIVKKIAIKIFLIGKNYEEEILANKRNVQLKNAAIIDETAVIYPQAKIRNHLNNPQLIRIGSYSRIQGDLVLYAHGGEIAIGDYCFIGPDTRIWSAKKIFIGNRVLVSHNVNIHDNNSHPVDSHLRHLDFVEIFSNGLQKENDLNEKEIIIEDDVWIGFNATIMKGVKIGRGSIVGANTIITDDVPPYSIIVGNPARIIKQAE
jgi:acetyltransferase-like isoleucine patch superfamily enzyme